MKNSMIGDVSSNVLGMIGDLCGKLKRGSITPEELDFFLNRRNPFEGRQQILAGWQAFYREIGIVVDFSGLRIPAKRRGFDRLIAVPQGTKVQQVYDASAELFRCWKYEDVNLDEIVTENDRDPASGSYAIWIRDRVEADEEWKGKLTEELRERGVPGITLLERLLYGLKFFKETGRHLDIKNATLCTGSRCRAGSVPWVYFYGFDGGVHVHWYFPRSARDRLRSREVVS